jgi:general secretion pathway protein D
MKLSNLLTTVLLLACTCSELSASSAAVENRGPIVKSISLNDASMQEVARLIGSSSGIPIIVSREAAKIKVNIYLQNAHCYDILNSICRSYGMWYKKDKDTGIIHIQTLDELKSGLQLYHDESVQVIPILYPAAEDVGDALQQLFVDRVVWVRPDEDSGNAYDKIKEALKRMELIAKKGTFDINSSSNSESSDDDDDDDDDNDNNKSGKRQSISKANTPKDPLKRLTNEKLLKALKNKLIDEKSSHVFDLAGEPGTVYIAALPQSNSLLLRSRDPKALKQITELIDKLDKPRPQVLLEVKILTVSLNDTNARAVDFLFESGDVSGGFANGMPTVEGGGQTILKPNKYLVPQGTGIDKQAAIFNAITDHFSLRLQMLEKDGRITRLATPNLLVADNEASKIFVGTEVTVMEKAEQKVTYTNASSGSQNPNISWEIEAPRRKIGVSMVITPRIHEDRTVTIRLLQEHSTLGSVRKNVFSGSQTTEDTTSILTDTSSGSAESGATGEDRFFISQDIDLQSLTTTVVGKDNNIIVIGGLIEERAEKEEDKTPWLSEIPVLGDLLFTRMKEVRKRQEILVVIRPYVLLAPGEAESVSRDFMQRISQHPSARGDIPALGVNFREDVAKPGYINPNDPWYKRLLQRLEVWSIDTENAPETQQARFEYHKRENKKQAEEKIEKLIKKEEQK